MRPASLPPEISAPLSRVKDRLRGFAEQIFWYPEVRSTNDVAALLADRGAPEGTVVIADAQSAGRGRHGRAWISPPGAGLYTSVILRPAAHAVELITIAAGVALAEGLQSATGVHASVKWPNDIYVNGRKVAGILAEAGSSGAGVQHVVLGFGINVMPALFPPPLAGRVTSLETELGRPVDRGLVLAECLTALAHAYEELAAGRASGVIAQWRRRAASTFGRAVEWDVADGARHGLAEDVDESGALLVRTEGGLVRVIAGEVRWR